MANGPSDFERAVMGLINFGFGFREGAAKRREFQQKLETRQAEDRAKKRKAQREELAELGAPLDVVLRGEELTRQPRLPGAAGPELGPADAAAVERFEQFQKRLTKQATRDPGLTAAVSELGQLRRKSEIQTLSEEEQRRVSALEAAVNRRTGLDIPAAPTPAPVPEPAPEGPGRFQRAREGAGRFLRGLTGRQGGSDRGTIVVEDPGTGQRRRISADRAEEARRRGLRIVSEGR